MSENVKVCVRVRPFNKREKERGAKCIIGMQGTSTTIKDPSKPEDEPKAFNFDNSYWSHDGYKEEADGTLVPTNDKYDTQQMVFEDVGNTVLTNAYDGFNTSLFAYGQTGSGKSYSMVGYGPNKGIVPIAFDSMFKKIAANTDDHIKFQVTFSMIEIYMEAVADLLTDGNKKLKVRQNPKEGGFFVDGVLKIPVSSYEEIDAQMNAAMQRRTVAATQMNATSSRAHTVVTMVFSTLITDKDTGKKTTRASEINLVDLAGSERANSTGATGARLKEGAQINLSLSALGNVISALATGKKNIPFRDSVLTWLLRESFGGNSETVMIATISPSTRCYDESLSTLRYADHTQQIVNQAIVNEGATAKVIRDLKNQITALKKQQEALLSRERVQMRKQDTSGSAQNLSLSPSSHLPPPHLSPDGGGPAAAPGREGGGRLGRSVSPAPSMGLLTDASLHHDSEIGRPDDDGDGVGVTSPPGKTRRLTSADVGNDIAEAELLLLEAQRSHATLLSKIKEDAHDQVRAAEQRAVHATAVAEHVKRDHAAKVEATVSRLKHDIDAVQVEKGAADARLKAAQQHIGVQSAQLFALEAQLSHANDSLSVVVQAGLFRSLDPTQQEMDAIASLPLAAFSRPVTSTSTATVTSLRGGAVANDTVGDAPVVEPPTPPTSPIDWDAIAKVPRAALWAHLAHRDELAGIIASGVRGDPPADGAEGPEYVAPAEGLLAAPAAAPSPISSLTDDGAVDSWISSQGSSPSTTPPPGITYSHLSPVSPRNQDPAGAGDEPELVLALADLNAAHQALYLLAGALQGHPEVVKLSRELDGARAEIAEITNETRVSEGLVAAAAVGLEAAVARAVTAAAAAKADLNSIKAEMEATNAKSAAATDTAAAAAKAELEAVKAGAAAATATNAEFAAAKYAAATIHVAAEAKLRGHIGASKAEIDDKAKVDTLHTVAAVAAAAANAKLEAANGGDTNPELEAARLTDAHGDSNSGLILVSGLEADLKTVKSSLESKEEELLQAKSRFDAPLEKSRANVRQLETKITRLTTSLAQSGADLEAKTTEFKTARVKLEAEIEETHMQLDAGFEHAQSLADQVADLTTQLKKAASAGSAADSASAKAELAAVRLARKVAHEAGDTTRAALSAQAIDLVVAERDRQRSELARMAAALALVRSELDTSMVAEIVAKDALNYLVPREQLAAQQEMLRQAQAEAANVIAELRDRNGRLTGLREEAEQKLTMVDTKRQELEGTSAAIAVATGRLQAWGYMLAATTLVFGAVTLRSVMQSGDRVEGWALVLVACVFASHMLEPDQ